MKLLKLLGASALLLLVYVSQANAEYSYQLVLPPDADNARLFGINNAGKAVGWFYTDVGFTSFEYDIKKEEYTMLGDEFVAMDISNTGVMVGNPGYAPWMCAILDKKGNMTELYPPSWNDDVSVCDARGVNPDGKVSGFVIDEDGVWWGFIYDPEYGTYEEFLPSSNTVGHGINAQGQHVGNVEDFGYLREVDGSEKIFAIEQSLYGITRARGISENGLMSGFFVDPDTWAFVGYVTARPEAEGFSVVSLNEDEILYISSCDPELPPAPDGYFALTDVIATAVRNDGVVAGICADYYIADDWSDWMELGRYGLIATPVK
jgi:hypothetical protein